MSGYWGRTLPWLLLGCLLSFGWVSCVGGGISWALGSPLASNIFGFTGMGLCLVLATAWVVVGLVKDQRS